MGVVLTLGKQGALCRIGGRQLFQPSFPAKAVDTTGAGDTFTGYFLAMLAQERPLEEALTMAAMAAAVAVTRPGAEPSIPQAAEVQSRLQKSARSFLRVILYQRASASGDFLKAEAFS